jgi:hypothetical protein
VAGAVGATVVSSVLGSVAAAVAVLASRDFLGSLDLERDAATAATAVGLASGALVVDHDSGTASTSLEKKNLQNSLTFSL